jgi:hypothetical protein
VSVRILRLTERFNRAARRLGVSGTLAGVEVAKVLASIRRESLPSPQDAETMMPPVAIYWFRRVPGHNLWLYFSFSDDEVTAVTLTQKPPIPLKE